MQRRMVLTGAGASAAGVFSGAASAADTMAANPTSSDLVNTLARSRASIPAHFDRTYMENAVVPFFLTGIYEGERPALPMIDVTLTKENALPHDLWGLIYQGWKPTPEEGVTVFLQGLEKRGDNNLRKRIYMSGRQTRHSAPYRRQPRAARPVAVCRRRCPYAPHQCSFLHRRCNRRLLTVRCAG
jgi:hypothetical protein